MNPYRPIGSFRSLESLAPFMHPAPDEEEESDFTPTEVAETDVESWSDSQDDEML